MGGIQIVCVGTLNKARLLTEGKLIFKVHLSKVNAQPFSSFNACLSFVSL